MGEPDLLSHVRWECKYHVVFIPKYLRPHSPMPEDSDEKIGSCILGFIKGMSAVRVHRELLQERRMAGLHSWASGYWVSTVGRDEETVRRYIREQETRDQG